jgi:hypothetical protein
MNELESVLPATRDNSLATGRTRLLTLSVVIPVYNER